MSKNKPLKINVIWQGLGKGKLYIAESRVSWVGDAGHQFSLTYEHISLHAVSKDTTTFPHSEHLYLMIDKKLTDSEVIYSFAKFA